MELTECNSPRGEYLLLLAQLPYGLHTTGDVTPPGQFMPPDQIIPDANMPQNPSQQPTKLNPEEPPKPTPSTDAPSPDTPAKGSAPSPALQANHSEAPVAAAPAPATTAATATAKPVSFTYKPRFGYGSRMHKQQHTEDHTHDHADDRYDNRYDGYIPAIKVRPDDDPEVADHHHRSRHEEDHHHDERHPESRSHHNPEDDKDSDRMHKYDGPGGSREAERDEEKVEHEPHMAHIAAEGLQGSESEIPNKIAGDGPKGEGQEQESLEGLAHLHREDREGRHGPEEEEEEELVDEMYPSDKHHSGKVDDTQGEYDAGDDVSNNDKQKGRGKGGQRQRRRKGGKDDEQYEDAEEEEETEEYWQPKDGRSRQQVRV